MPSLRLIKNLQNTNPNLIQLLNSYIFGDLEVKPYNQNKIYNRTDLTMVYNNSTHRFELFRCQEDGVTGVFNHTRWVEDTVSEYITGKKVNKKMVQLKTTQPDEPANIIWYEQYQDKGDGKYAAFQKVKLENGSYAVVLPITTTDEVFTDYNSRSTLTNHLMTMGINIEANKDSVVEDVLSIVYQLSSYFPKPIKLNHLYVDDLITADNVTIYSGAFMPGKIIM